MKIILWIGNEPNQIALANKIHEIYPIDTIFVETKKTKQKVTHLIIFQKIIEKLFLSKISQAWFNMLSHYKLMYTSFPEVKIVYTDNINSELVFQQSVGLTPDLIIVSGTRLIKEKLLSVNPSIGILNLHTGLSPYMKGGPNCTNWCIANNQLHLIGNTIMWIDKGIDSGNIITTELTCLDGTEDLSKIHIKVMEHAHQLYLKAITSIVNGKQSNVPQLEIAQGQVFYTKDWTLDKKISLVRNLRKYAAIVNSNDYKKEQSQLKLIKIE